MNTIVTERLIGEKLENHHLPFVLAMHSDVQAMKTLGGVRSEEQTHDFFKRNIEHWEKYGFGMYILKNKAGAFVGRAGLRHVDIQGQDEIEVAYALMPHFWGMGLATEIVKKLIENAFMQLHIKKLVCFTDSSNRASQRVMQKCGFMFDKFITHNATPDVFFCQLFATQWKK